MDGTIDSPQPGLEADGKTTAFAVTCLIAICPALLGALLLAGTIRENSATYDEVAYARIACRWWRGGDAAEITRMGSPVTFWKWQAAPALAWLDATGRGGWIDEPRTRLPDLLPWLRASSAWLWFLGLFVVEAWAARAYGTTASGFAGFVYALSPNLRAHGALMTMETPLWTFMALATMCLCERLRTGKRCLTAASAMAAGTAFSMKFTAVALPFLFAGAIGCREWYEAKQRGQAGIRLPAISSFVKATRFGVGFVAMMILTNLALTRFARIEPSERTGSHPWVESRFSPATARYLKTAIETPMPVDWVGFATQMRHQRSGGPSYLFGKTSNHGWPRYYLVALAVKCPLLILISLLLRPIVVRALNQPEEWLVPLVCGALMAVACLGSKRNYGYRYLLPLAPLAIVWLSGLTLSRTGRVVAAGTVAALAWASIVCHPYELTYFNVLGGGKSGGHRVLADSNLDWGQGLITFRELIAKRPELADTTLFAFGDIEPAIWGIDVTSYAIDASDRFDQLPKTIGECRTKYVAISASLLFGPWGPPGYFSAFAEQTPVAVTADGTIRVFRNPIPKRTAESPGE